MKRDGRLFLEYDNAPIGIAALQLPGCSESDDAAADHHHIRALSGRGMHSS